MIDGRLAADRRVHLRQQCGWNLDERDAALVGRRGKSGQIANHAAPKGDQCRGALRAELEQPCMDFIERRPVLVRFPLGDNDDFIADANRKKRGSQDIQVKRRDDGVGYDDCATRRERRQQLAATRQNPFADMDRIAALSERNGQGPHRR